MLEGRWGAALGLTGFLCLGAFGIGRETLSPHPTLKAAQHTETYDPCQYSDEKSTERCTNYRIANYTWALASFTGLLAVVSIIQIGFLLRADRTTRISADAAKAAANALPVVERAYVYPIIASTDGIDNYIEKAVLSVPISDPGNTNIPLKEMLYITFTIKNFGKTPAILRSAYAGFGIHPIGIDFGLAIPESILGEMESTSNLMAGLQIGITPQQALNIRAGQTFLLLRGQIHFEDILVTKFIFGWDNDIKRMTLRNVETTEDKTTQNEWN
jgi:hypothetical protein